MTWKTPKEGDVRTRWIFALVPRLCDDGYTRWLCRLWVVETRTMWMDGGDYWRQTYAGLNPPSRVDAPVARNKEPEMWG